MFFKVCELVYIEPVFLSFYTRRRTVTALSYHMDRNYFFTFVRRKKKATSIKTLLKLVFVLHSFRLTMVLVEGRSFSHLPNSNALAYLASQLCDHDGVSRTPWVSCVRWEQKAVFCRALCFTVCNKRIPGMIRYTWFVSRADLEARALFFLGKK